MTYLNIVSVIVTVVLFTVFGLVYRRFRRHLKNSEGAIAIVNGMSDEAGVAEPPRDGGVDPAPRSIIYSDKTDLRS